MFWCQETLFKKVLIGVLAINWKTIITKKHVFVLTVLNEKLKNDTFFLKTYNWIYIYILYLKLCLFNSISNKGLSNINPFENDALTT